VSVKGILFDKDGTLIDFERTYAPGTAEVIARLCNSDPVLSLVLAQSVDLDLTSLKFDPQSVVIAGTGRQIAEIWHPHLRDWEFEDLAHEVDNLYTEFTEKHVTAFDDLPAAVTALESLGLELGVATNDAEASAHRHIAKINMVAHFPFVVGYDSGHGAKPGPGMVLAFADKIGAAPGEVMMVGDSLHDLHSAKAAGAIAVGVTTGMASHDDLRNDADYVLSALSQLPDLVSHLADT